MTVNIPEFAFTNFSLVDLGTLGYFSGVITQPTESQPIGTILVQVPYGTNTNLAANWVDSLDINRLIANPVFVGNPLDLNLQIPLVSTNDYTNPVTLNVLALPFYMATYVVTESIAVPANNVFTSYYLTVGNKSYPGVINQQGLQKTIQVEVPVGTDVSAAVATFTTYGAATVTVPKIGIPPYTVQTSGVTINNFSKGAVNYTVTSGINTNLYAVTVINPTP